MIIEYSITLDRFAKWCSLNDNDIKYNDIIKGIYSHLDVDDGNCYVFNYMEFGKYDNIQKFIMDFYEEFSLDKNKSLVIYDIT
jgi:hypothetical protein